MSLSTIEDCLVAVDKTDGDAHWFFLEPKDAAARDALVVLLAKEIARSCSDPSDTVFDAWLKRYEGGAPHDEATAVEVEAYLLADFKVAAKGKPIRLRGAVVEHLWAALVGGLAGGWGAPVIIEHEHFSVIDHGGDGLCFYEADGSELRFRLWESKSHTAASTSVTSTVTGAAAQLQEHGPEYLARLSKVMQLNKDPRVAEMAGVITRLWAEQDVRASVGVVVGTTSSSVPNRPFQGLGKAFSYDDKARRDGLIIRIDDFKGFCLEVREHILKGIS